MSCSSYHILHNLSLHGAHVAYICSCVIQDHQAETSVIMNVIQPKYIIYEVGMKTESHNNIISQQHQRAAESDDRQREGE
jgi:hypothetical protein